MGPISWAHGTHSTILELQRQAAQAISRAQRLSAAARGLSFVAAAVRNQELDFCMNQTELVAFRLDGSQLRMRLRGRRGHSSPSSPSDPDMFSPERCSKWSKSTKPRRPPPPAKAACTRQTDAHDVNCGSNCGSRSAMTFSCWLGD